MWKAKPLSPEVLALIPNGIENFVPRCIVCTNPVPPKRARGRSKDTCCQTCQIVRQLYRKWVLVSSKCVACFHPSTPAERQNFIEWRKERGEIRRKMGRPTAKKALDKPESVSGTPDIAISDQAEAEKPQ